MSGSLTYHLFSMKMPKSTTVNLFKSRKVGFLDKFMKWALGIGRFLVILTETVALLAFLYRFSLDRNLIDLHDGIKSKQAIVKLLKNNEDTFRNLQERLAIAKTLIETEKQTQSTFNDIISFGGNTIIFTNVVISDTQVKINAQTQSITTLKTFIDSLKSYSKISSISIDSIENRSASGIVLVSITATLKKSIPSTQNVVTQ